MIEHDDTDDRLSHDDKREDKDGSSGPGEAGHNVLCTGVLRALPEDETGDTGEDQISR